MADTAAPLRALAMLLVLLLPGGCRGAVEGEVREPAVAGSFYPAGAGALKEMIKGHLERAEVASLSTPRGLVVPHAGYVYSGATAAYAYKILKARAGEIDRVILLAPSHQAAFSGVIVNERTFRTPLGTYRTDFAAIEKLKKSPFPRTNNAVAETREHSDEVQVPFLQMVLPRAKLVPLVVGELTPASTDAIARALATIIDEKTVILASSDFTHYGPRFGYTPPFESDVRTGILGIDRMAVELILGGNVDDFRDFLDRTGATVCGRNPITLLLKVFEVRGWPTRGRLLHYTTSGELTGDYSSSVSYASISVGALDDSGDVTSPAYLSEGEQSTLLKLARHVLKRFVNEGVAEFPDSDLKDFAITEGLRKEYGVFVTLHKGAALRGCIGHIQPQAPLYRGVIMNAMNAAARDPRFERVAAAEDRELSIEISVMSPLVRVSNLDEIVVGRDGLVLTNGPYSGVFLPQVPVDQRWDKTTYLEQLGLKARIGPDAYRRKGTEIQRFTAQVFHER